MGFLYWRLWSLYTSFCACELRILYEPFKLCVPDQRCA